MTTTAAHAIVGRALRETKAAPDVTTGAVESEQVVEDDASTTDARKDVAAAPPAIPNLADVARPAPGATPDGAFAFLAGDDGTEAWLVKADDQSPVGYIRDGGQPDRAVSVADAAMWAQIVDGLGLSERPVPATAVSDDEPADAADAADAAGAPEAAGSRGEGKAMTFGAAGRQNKPAEDDGVVQSGIMIALMVPDGEGADLALDDEEALPPEDLHITLAFLGDVAEVADPGRFVLDALEAIREVTAGHKSIRGEVSGVGRFSGPEGDTFYLSYDSPTLNRLREDLFDALDKRGVEPSRDHGFTPHISLAALGEGEASPMDRVPPKALTFDRITLAFGESRIDTPLGTDDEETDPEVVEAASRTKPDSTAEAALDDPWQHKAVTVGTDVRWPGGQGRVDLLASTGTLPGVTTGDVEGKADDPVARVVLGDGSRVGVKVAALTTVITEGSVEHARAALAGLVADYDRLVPDGTPRVDAAAVKAVYDRGVKSWSPGTFVDRMSWALGRTGAFLAIAAGREVKGYGADRDLLPAGHPAAPRRVHVVPVEAPTVVSVPDGAVVEAKSVEALLTSLRTA
jgi:2'-5' RNA ligase